MDDRLFDLIRQGATIRQLQLMLETGVDVNSHNERHETPLMAVMINIHDVTKRCQVVKVLLVHGANINNRNLRGQTPLMYACILNQLDTLDILLDEPALDCNIQDFEGNTAFMYACALSKTESVRKLVCAYQHALELDPHIANVEGATALDYALDSKDAEIEDLVGTITMETVINPSDETEALNPEIDKCVKDSKKSSKRIKQLAGSLENNRKLDFSSMDEKPIVVWKNDDDGNTRVVWSNKSPTSTENVMTKKKSVLNVHIPRAHDELIDDDVTDASEQYAVVTDPSDRNITDSKDSNIQSVTNDIDSCSISPKRRPENTKTDKRESKSKKHKRKNRAKKVHASGDVAENIFLQTIKQPKREFAEEVAFCNKIYETGPYSSEVPVDYEPEIENMERLKVIMKDITDRALLNFQKGAINVRRETPENTAKLNCMDLSPKDRGRLLSRTIWSVYGEPLPPIPITSTTLDRVVRGITKLKRYLGHSRYHPGRLLSVDPELWCIVESMRSP